MLYVIGKPTLFTISIWPMEFVGITKPLHPDALSLNCIGCVNVIGTKMYP